MINRRKSQLDSWRTQTWSRVCAVAFGLRSGNAVERRVLKRDEKTKAKAISGAWRGYLRGTSTPYNGWTPVPDSKWARLARQACPESWPWFATPFWYLLEDEDFSPGQIVDCAELLPECFREYLLYEAEGLTIRTPLRLDPWALGATACAMRRAELAGNAPTMRWAAVALIWQPQQHVSMLDDWIAEPLDAVRQMLLTRFKTMLYFDGMLLPIGPSDLERFGIERDKYIAWSQQDFTEEGTSRWPPPKPVLQT